MTALIAVLVPTLSRPNKVAPLIQNLKETTNQAEIYFIVDQNDYEQLKSVRDNGANLIVVPPDRRSWAKKINDGFLNTKERWLFLGADDIKFHKGWYESVAPILVHYDGVIGTNDMGNEHTISGRTSTHPFVARSYGELYGVEEERNKLCFEGYFHNFCDTELVLTAKKRNKWLHVQSCLVEHMHPLWGKSSDDNVYQLGRSTYGNDEETFRRRYAKYGWQW